MRRLPMLVLAAALLYADPPPAVMDLLARAAGALSANNVPAFLKTLDPSMPDYAKLRTEVTVLLSQADVASSVEVRADKGDGHGRELDLDWFLEITSQAPEGPSVRRRQLVHCRVVHGAKGWKIAGLDPVTFFAPPTQ